MWICVNVFAIIIFYYLLYYFGCIPNGMRGWILYVFLPSEAFLTECGFMCFYIFLQTRSRLTTDQLSDYYIYNITGQLMMKVRLYNETTTINVASLAAGIYYLRVTEHTVRFEKQ